MTTLLSTIRAKIALVVVAGIVCAMLLVSVTSAWREMTRRTTDKNNELSALGQALAATIGLPLARGDAASAAQALSAMRQMPAIRFVRVLDRNEQPIAQFGVGIVLAGEADASAPLQPGSFSSLSRTRVAFSVPVISGGTRVGRLELIADISDLRSAFWGSITAAFISALVAGLVGLLVAAQLQPLVTRPIAALTEAMHQVRATHDFNRIVERRSNDEAGQLVDAFNEMLSHIRARDHQLALHREHLEQQVDERTAQLAVAKQAAEAANAAKTDFLTAMSHEIRTPMHGMMTMAELLLAADLPPKPRRHAEIIERSGRSLLAIVNDILDFSKIEAGRMDLERIATSPVAVAEEVTQLFAARAAEKGLRLDLRCGRNIPAWLLGDPVRLAQILSNLVGNALKFTEQGGVVVGLDLVASGSTGGQRLLFSVTDTGIGIPATALPGLFEAFTQAESSTTRRFGGTGVGLAICRRLVDAMGGKLDVKSSVGKGSTFSFSIGVEHAAAPAADVRSTNAESTTAFAGLRVLAADDNAVNREVLQQALALFGVDVVLVEDGAAAVAAFTAEKFDAVFMDCSMPVLDGFAATREIRAYEAREKRAATPVIALTAFVVGREAHAWRDAGMTDCLTKPFTMKGLSECLGRWVEPVAGGRAQAAAATDHVPGPNAARSTAAGPIAAAEASPSSPLLVDDADADDAAPVLDTSVIAEIARMDRNGVLLERIVGLFVANVGAYSKRIECAVDGGGAHEIASAAHALKSMSRSIGASRVARVADALESSAQMVAQGRAQFDSNGLRREVSAAVVALQELIAARPSRPVDAASRAA